jgi:hypothetical protein
MKSVVNLTIDAPQAKVAALMAEPANNARWMDDTEYQPVSGTPGQPGSTFRLIPKDGTPAFVATVVARNLPNELRLLLEAPAVDVEITDRFVALSPQKTLLVSEEVFRFKGAKGTVAALFARRAIRSAHRKHMESFKRFAEAMAE